MTSLTETIHKHYNLHAEEWNGSRQTLLADVDRGYFVEYMKAPFISLAKSLYPEGYWIDKTPIPSMISMAPLLAEVWPSARFIFMKRRGLENLSSRLNKFASLSFEFHCHDWARCMQLWGAVRDQLVGRAIEIDQNCLNKSSDKVAAELSTLIGLDPEESTRVASYLREYFPERSADPTNHLSLEGLDWSPGDKELFLEVCGPVMRDFGYSLTTSYYLPRHRKDVVII